MDIFDLIVWIFKQVRKARDASIAQQTAQLQALSQPPQRPVTPFVAQRPVPPARVPIVVSPMGYTPAGSPAAVVAPIAQVAPSAEGLLVSGLFTQPRSLVAAFVASELLGPPVAFRGH